MAARAMWKGVICFGKARVPVKLYSAIEDRSVHFRLLHRKDRMPVRQVLINFDTEAVVPFADSRRGYQTSEGQVVMLTDADRERLRPRPSRDIEVLDLLPLNVIDRRWYARPYYLGPDGADDEYWALVTALEESKREGLARWVMRRTEYVGALRLHRGYPMLVTLRHAEEVVPLESARAPRAKKLDAKELSMARQLIGMLQAPFEPAAYEHEQRERILDMIETKRRGGRIKIMPRRRARSSADIRQALQASLQEERQRA